MLNSFAVKIEITKLKNVILPSPAPFEFSMLDAGRRAPNALLHLPRVAGSGASYS